MCALPRAVVPLALLVALWLPATAAETGSIEGKLTGTEKYFPNTVVHIVSAQGDFKPPSEPVVMDQKAMTFVPKVLPVLMGSEVKFLNSDPAEHTVYSPDGETYDLGGWGQFESKNHTFKQLGSYTQLCKKHPQMIGYVVVLQNPYFTVAGADGGFKIDDVPPGSYEVAIWNERRRCEPVKVTVEAGKASNVELALIR